ncbi:uncharacterized protein CLUP02_14520 [Colletotrichum lupini]|uniref:Uncharacterized protein n=1 Tax=Colletotrichum lupini TaxID=145971 RepID=A0A9Q8T4E9_9PEZI|nr:uncharacterized protein CLUP02_14520 [Colletotrichum lupini]UQC88993.1 hypothetical protein CLUP02_14520 [Colletotrichum lupini]
MKYYRVLVTNAGRLSLIGSNLPVQGISWWLFVQDGVNAGLPCFLWPVQGDVYGKLSFARLEDSGFLGTFGIRGIPINGEDTTLTTSSIPVSKSKWGRQDPGKWSLAQSYYTMNKGKSPHGAGSTAPCVLPYIDLRVASWGLEKICRHTQGMRQLF